MTLLTGLVLAATLAADPFAKPSEPADPPRPGAARCDEGGGGGSSRWKYAIAPRLRSMTYPVRFANARHTADDLGTLAYLRTEPSFGLVVHEFVPNGPIGFCAGGILVGGGARAVQTGFDTYRWVPGGGYGGDTAGAAAYLEIGPGRVHGEIQGWVNGWYGYRFGLAVMEIEERDIGKMELRSPIRRELERRGYTYVTTGGAWADINNVLRAPPVSWGGGGVELTLDVPIFDLLLGGLLALNVLEPEPFAPWVYGFGRPRATLAIHQALGPLWLRGTFTVPTELIVLPWHFLDAQLAIETGLVF